MDEIDVNKLKIISIERFNRFRELEKEVIYLRQVINSITNKKKFKKLLKNIKL